MAESYRVTSVGVTPAEDRAKRMRFYFVAMSLRMACVASLFFLRGWWILLAAVGAVFLPYFAVMIGNASSNTDDERPDAPPPLEIAEAADTEVAAPVETVIVVDAPSYRRTTAPRPETATSPETADEETS